MWIPPRPYSPPPIEDPKQPGRATPNKLVRDKSLHRGFCASGTRIQGRILGNEFRTPEFWTRILGSNFLTLFFPPKEPRSKIHPREIHLPKITFQNSTQKSGEKIHIAPPQGHLANKLVAKEGAMVLNFNSLCSGKKTSKT